MIDIAVRDLVKEYEVGQPVLNGLTFQVDTGERVGILGRNGAGKTTLFRILTGQEEADSGQVIIPAGKRLGLISQIPVYPARYTVEDVLRTAFDGLKAMEQEMEEFKLSSIQSRILGFLWYKRNHHEKAFQKELESEFKIRRSSVTSVIQGLEKHGLVERRSVSTDARQKELVLTEEGVRVQRQVIERIEEMEKRVNGWLSPEEREWWLRCVNKIETGLKEAEYD